MPSNMTFGVNLNPKEDNTYSLGNATHKWKLYADSINDMSMVPTVYAECHSAATTAAKSVASDGYNLIVGTILNIRFVNGNSASSVTLNINSTGAIPIQFAAGNTTTDINFATNSVVQFVYNGTSYVIVTNATDTKNTAGSTNSSSKLFLVGAASQATNPQTYSHTYVYETAGELSAASLGVNASTAASKVILQWNNTDDCLDFVFQ